MKNLAGVADCDVYIRDELARAGIEIIEGERHRGEVAAMLTGKLGPFIFERAWRYWVVKGNVPLGVAREMYTSIEGRESVRVNGDCTCPGPDERADWIAPDGRTVVPTKERAALERSATVLRCCGGWESVNKAWIFSDDPASVGAAQYVTAYHIDTQAGLNLFTETLRRHGLVSTKEAA